jgi:hypothetical protein
MKDYFRLVTVCVAFGVAAGVVAAEQWELKADWAESCCCAPACPCVFGSAPTRGHCEGSALLTIDEGSYRDVDVDGLNVVVTFSMGEWARFYIDEEATDLQMDAIVKLLKEEETFGMLVGGDVKLLSTERANINVEKSDSTIAFSVPESNVELEVMTGVNGEPIRIENLGVPWFVNGYTQYTAVTTNHQRGDKEFAYEGTNGATSRVEASGKTRTAE